MDPARIVPDDQVWLAIKSECARAAEREPLLAGFLYATVLSQPDIEESLSYLLASKLDNSTLPALGVRDIILQVLNEDECIQRAILADLQAVVSRDPACPGYANPLLYFKGFQAIQAYRVAHHYWLNGRPQLALYLQSRISEVFAVDIHPGATIGGNFFIDHATGVVIGETTIIGENVRLYQAVTLGAKRFTQDESGALEKGVPRHPILEDEVVVYAGATILGRITIGRGSSIGGNVWLTRSVPPGSNVTQADVLNEVQSDGSGI
mgnify:CR=1 FL=1